MLKINYLNICFYLLINCIIFYLFLMIMNNDFTMLKGVFNIKDGTDLFYYLWIILFFPILDIILFSIPLYYSLKTKNKVYFILNLLTVFIIEYLMNVYFTSQKIFDIDVLLKVIIGVIVFLIFFYKSIFEKFKSI